MVGGLGHVQEVEPVRLADALKVGGGAREKWRIIRD